MFDKSKEYKPFEKKAEDMSQKKLEFFEKLFEKKSGQVHFSVMSMVLIAIIYIFFVAYIDNFRAVELAKDMQITEDFNIIYDLQIQNSKDGSFFVGNIMRYDSEIKKVILVLENEDETIALNTDINEKRNEDNRKVYEFSTYIDANEINVERCFEITIMIEYLDHRQNIEQKVRINSCTYLRKWEMYSYNIEKSFLPKFTDEIMSTVMQQGTLCGYNLEYGMWVYLLDNSLYWVVSEDFVFNESGKTYIPFQLHTYDKSVLSEEWQELGYDVRSFYFEEHEIDFECENYRVATCKVPLEYKPEYIKTGLYNLKSKNWVFKLSFPIR